LQGQWQINRALTTAKIVGTTQVAAAVGVDIAAAEDEEAAVVVVEEEEEGEEDTATGAPPTTEEQAAPPRIEVATGAGLEGTEEGAGAGRLTGVVVGAVVVAGEGPPSRGIGSPPTLQSRIPRISCSRACRK
jgi:hypothetical protein